MVAPGNVADLAVFALDELHYDNDEFVYDLPGGGSRLRRPEGGYRATFVDGVPVQLDGKITGALPGSGHQLRRLSTAVFDELRVAIEDPDVGPLTFDAWASGPRRRRPRAAAARLPADRALVAARAARARRGRLPRRGAVDLRGVSPDARPAGARPTRPQPLAAT